MDDMELHLMTQIFKGMGASDETIEKASKEYETHIAYYENLSEEDKRLEIQSMETLTENMTFEVFTNMSTSDQEKYVKRLKEKLRLQ